MQRVSTSSDGRRRLPAVAAVAMALALALAASSRVAAAEPKSADGLLQFPNVHLIHAPQAAGAAAAPQGGMRAYKDSADSELRGPTTEEMQEAAGSGARIDARRSALGDVAIDSEPSTFALPGGGIGALLDESSMQYSVVVRQADGSLKEVCVTGPAAAEAVARQAAATTAANRETRNVR